MARTLTQDRDPNSGGSAIPPETQKQVEHSIQAYAAEHFKGRYNRIEVTFRKQFCYIDAYEEPVLAPGWPPPDYGMTREELIERQRATPTHLCRLRHFSSELWGFAFYTYSNEKYQLSVFADGSFFGTPEDAFAISAEVYL